MEYIKKILSAIGEPFVLLWKSIKDTCVKFGLAVAKFAKKFALGVVHFPWNFVNFFKAVGLEIYHFFRGLPEAFKTKDGIIETLVAIGAIIIWSMPVFVVIYVLTWFLSK